MKNGIEAPRCKIHNVKGYAGLPDIFLVESQYGWLSADSFSGELSQAHTYKTHADAMKRLLELYPTALILKD